MKEEEKAHLWKAVDALSDVYRIPLLLYYMENQNVASIAKLLSIPQGTVKSRLYKARKLLEKELEQEISKAIDEMPEESRIVFKKSRFELKKNEEIAQELGISVNTVKYHIKRALSFLRERLRGYLPLLILVITMLLRE